MAAAKGESTLICDYLGALGVPHTAGYSNSRARSMPFKTLFGLSKVLADYGITSEGYELTDPEEITLLTPPFIASTAGGPLVVTEVGDSCVSYLSDGVTERMPRNEFMQAWCGKVLLSYPAPDASEPDYKLHARLDFFNRAKRWVLAGGLLLLAAWLFASGGLWRSAAAWFVVAFDLLGLYFTYLLVQKSLNIHSGAADRVCGVLQAGGCDRILEMKASKFFGLFGWSEVGFAYFSVSLLTLLIYPGAMPWLALCNLCCLPFTLWSIWYQRFRARHWCTLCVSVQCTLWLLFFSYLAGGWIRSAWPLQWSFVMLGVAYLTVMLGINALMPLIEKKKDDETD